MKKFRINHPEITSIDTSSTSVVYTDNKDLIRKEINMSKKIRFITCPEGDWEVIKIDGEFEEQGHSMNEHQWLDLLKHLGFEIEKIEISDEDMEGGNF